ncbi:hypothetical protein GE09DRAFT_778955 [Coniochaeta sp. 2T2.1]|nr:hypothetical protein GE09DRAFT_778955 [Coniochaeta sp. 2T2.1]
MAQLSVFAHLVLGQLPDHGLLVMPITTCIGATTNMRRSCRGTGGISGYSQPLIARAVGGKLRSGSWHNCHGGSTATGVVGMTWAAVFSSRPPCSRLFFASKQDWQAPARTTNDPPVSEPSSPSWNRIALAHPAPDRYPPSSPFRDAPCRAAQRLVILFLHPLLGVLPGSRSMRPGLGQGLKAHWQGDQCPSRTLEQR